MMEIVKALFMKDILEAVAVLGICGLVGLGFYVRYLVWKIAKK